MKKILSLFLFLGLCLISFGCSTEHNPSSVSNTMVGPLDLTTTPTDVVSVTPTVTSTPVTPCGIQPVTVSVVPALWAGGLSYAYGVHWNFQSPCVNGWGGLYINVTGNPPPSNLGTAGQSLDSAWGNNFTIGKTLQQNNTYYYWEVVFNQAGVATIIGPENTLVLPAIATFTPTPSPTP